MKIFQDKNFVRFILPAIVLIAILIGGYYYNERRQALERATRVAALKQAPISFDVEVSNFHQDYKLSLIATRQADKLQVDRSLPLMIEKWRRIADYYGENQPADYGATRDWPDKLEGVFESIVKATNAAEANNYPKAHDYLMRAGETISKLRQENNKTTIGDDMLRFYKSVKQVTDAPDKAAVMKLIMDLKLNFTGLKKYVLSAEYEKEIANLEKMIGEMDKFLPGPDWDAAHKGLESAFNKLFLQFG